MRSAMEEQVRRGVRRTVTAARIADLVGRDQFTITDLRDGWPSLGTLVVNGNPLQVALFAGSVFRSHRERDSRERRFQNPGQDRPIVLNPQRYPLLLGLLEGDQALHIERPVLMLADPVHRAGRGTRFSVFASVASLVEAEAKGWSEALNSRGETIRCLYPQLLPVVVAGLLDDALPPSYSLQSVIEGSGLLDVHGADIPAAAERARRAAATLVRDAKFSKRIVEAYGGRCAMCGLDADLVQGAHIYPVSAPGSRDEPWNGLALCPNHHLAFDKHLLAVHPDTREVVLSPVVRAQAEAVTAMKAFVGATFPRLAEPADASARPHADMFSKRYDHYGAAYGWLGELRLL